jgi:hypothetical protein
MYFKCQLMQAAIPVMAVSVFNQIKNVVIIEDKTQLILATT